MKNKSQIYISHPYGGKANNLAHLDKIMNKLILQYSESHVFISPIHNYSFMTYSNNEYGKQLACCIDLLDKCDFMLIFGEWKDSTGCLAEIDYCKRNKKNYFILDDNLDILEMHIYNKEQIWKC